MRRWLRAVAGFCLGTVTAALSAQGLPAKPQCDDVGSTMLWQVQGPGLQAGKVSVQLFGSIHVGQPEFYPLPTVVDKYFRAADTLVFEVDPRTVSSPQAALRMQQLGTLPAGNSIDKVVDAATLSSLHAVLKKLGVPVGMVSQMKPWMVTMVLSSVQVQAMGYNPSFGVENYLMDHRPQAAHIAELETLDSQLSLLDSFDQKILLHYSLQDFTSTSEQLNSMVSAWRCGDHHKLADILFSAKSDDSADLSPTDQAALEKLMRQLFDDRNKLMADKIEQFIRTGTGDYFVTVGAGHLLGDNSVVSQLQKKGFTVTPVRNTP